MLVLLLVSIMTLVSGGSRLLATDSGTLQLALDQEARAFAMLVSENGNHTHKSVQQLIELYPFSASIKTVYVLDGERIRASLEPTPNQLAETSRQLRAAGLVVSEQVVMGSKLRVLLAAQPTAWNWWPELILAALGLTLGLFLAFLNSLRLNRALDEEMLSVKRSLTDALATNEFDKPLRVRHGFAVLAEPLAALFQTIVQAQQALANANDKNAMLRQEIEQRIRARTQELEESRAEAERANDAKSNFLATMSHELRTPMNGIIGTVDLLRKTRLSQPQFRMTDTIRDSSFSLLRILDDILDFSKIEAGKLELETIPLSVNAVVESVGQILSSMASQRQLDLRIYVDPSIPDGLLGDPVRLRQILYNLAGNALKFTETTAGQRGRVWLRAELLDDNIEFCRIRLVVRDNGKGMSARQQQTIFQPFTQAEGSITRKYGGTGLGLSICQRLTELMFGRIMLESEIGKGTEFIVELPMRRSDEADALAQTEFRDLQLILLTADPDHKEAIQAYSQAAGATLLIADKFESLRQFVAMPPTRASVTTLFVLDSCNNPDLLTQLAPLWSTPGLSQNPVLVLTEQADLVDESTEQRIYLHCHPLVRSTLFDSFLMLSGKKPKLGREGVAYDPIVDAPSIEQARELGRLILLAEDNPMNQKVISDQLHALGYAVEIADDGQIALDKWRLYRYPLLLTDLAMPNMSGYDLAQAIRKEAVQYDDDDVVYTRIIALTANALKGEEQRCRAFGMDDFLTKPIELAHLQQVLQRWLPAANQAITPQEKPKMRAAESPICFTTIANFLGKDPKKHEEYLNYFVRHGAELQQEIHEAAQQQDRAKLHALAHQLKSVAKSVGALAMSALALKLEHEADQGDWHDLDDLVAQLEQRYQDVARYVTERY